jgi:hypothetical protein
MKYLAIYFDIIIIGNLIFIAWHFGYLFFLKQTAITPSQAEDLALIGIKKRVKVQGNAIGVAVKKGFEVIRIDNFTLSGVLALNISGTTRTVFDNSGKIAYGEEAIALGKVGIIHETLVMYKIKYLSINKDEHIQKNLNKRYTICILLAIILRGVLYYVHL